MKKLMKFNVILTVAIVAFLTVSYSVMAADSEYGCPEPAGWAIFNDYKPCVLDPNHFWKAGWFDWFHFVCPNGLFWNTDMQLCTYLPIIKIE